MTYLCEDCIQVGLGVVREEVNIRYKLNHFPVNTGVILKSKTGVFEDVLLCGCYSGAHYLAAVLKAGL